MKNGYLPFFVAMESPTLMIFSWTPPFIGGFSIATLDYQRVTLKMAIAGSGSADGVEISVGAWYDGDIIGIY